MNDAAAMRDWRLAYEGYEPGQEGLREALCTLGNGYFATRGAAPDSSDDGVHYPGTYLAGGYNRLSTEIGGRKIENEDLVNLPNWLALTFRIDDGPWFRLDDVELLSFHQALDVRAGVLHRDLRLRDAAGRTTRWRERRIVSMAEPHLAGLCVALTAEDWSGRLTVRSGLDGSVSNNGVARYRDLAGRHFDTLAVEPLGTDAIFLRCRTSQSLVQVAQAARTRLYGDDGGELDAERHTQHLADRITQEIACAVPAGATIVVEKIVAVHTSRDRASSEPGLEARRTVGHAGRFDTLLAAHQRAWQHLWEDCDIEIEDGADAQTALKLRFNIFHLLQTTSVHSVDLDVGVPARGWHGEAYRGHIFWDELLNRACDLPELLPGPQCRHLCERIGLGPDEIEHWRDISCKLRVPFHGDGIISQFEGYGDLEEFDWRGYEKKYGDIQRLDRLLEAEGDSPNRYKVSKQADVLMLFYLFSADELALLFEQLGYPFDRDTIPKNIDYYIARTSHGSTLSGVAHSWVAARSNRPRSWRLFQRALDSDIVDVQGGTTPEGIHVGAMAGSVDLVQRCYIGIEMRANVLHFDPALPDDLRRVRARLRYQRQVLDIDVDHDVLKITSGVTMAAPITIAYRGHYRDVAPGASYEFRLLKPEARDRDENRPG